MWQQWFDTPGLRYATGTRLTALKFDAARRTDMTDTERRGEILDWLERSRQPGFNAWLANQATDAIRRAAIDLRLAVGAEADDFARERDQLLSEQDQLVELCRQLRAAEQSANAQAAEARATVQAVQATRAWRVVTRIWRVRDRLLRRYHALE